MSRGRSEAHPPPKVKHDRTSNGRIILFMLASFASSAVGCHDESGPHSLVDSQRPNQPSSPTPEQSPIPTPTAAPILKAIPIATPTLTPSPSPQPTPVPHRHTRRHR